MTQDETLIQRFLSPTSAGDYRIVYGCWIALTLGMAVAMDGIISTTRLDDKYFVMSTFPLLHLTGVLSAFGGAWMGKLVGISAHAGAAFVTFVWFLFSLRVMNV